MKLFVLALVLFATAAHAHCQSDDIASMPLTDGSTLCLSSQPAPIGGYMWYHVESAQGRTLQTGPWTTTSDRRVQIISHGAGYYLPVSRFKPLGD